MKTNAKVLLMIMDGWGEGDHSKADAIWNADTPFFKSLSLSPDWAKSSLIPCGEAVGLPEGQMGNSEVGHLNIGAGRVVYQDLVKINRAISDGSIKSNTVLVEAMAHAKKHNTAVHLIGLMGDGGVHSLSSHMMALCDMATDASVKKVFVHALTDGRDTDPRSGYAFVKEVYDHIQQGNARIATLCGRYYTMDRDKRWERIKIGYDLLVNGVGKKHQDVLQAIQESYDEGVTDEFIKPVVITDPQGQPLGLIQENDVVICVNFRTDRLREITTVLTQQNMPDAGMHTIPLHYVTMTPYDESYKHVQIAFDKDDVKMTLGEVISLHGLKQIRIAETEKYPHVTFFFNGGREEAFEGEKRILIPSPKVATYDLKPEMSAFEVRDAILPEITPDGADFICLNFANADMVGHTGFYQAILQALAAVDRCAEAVAQKAIASGYSVIITADHGNADMVLNDDGSPNTAHSMNPVPCFLNDPRRFKLSNGKLADLAPTILKLMGITIPEEMDGTPLV